MMIKRLLCASMVIGLVAVLPACRLPWQKKEETEAASSKLYVLNVLDPEQYNEAHIPGSVNVPCSKVAEWATGVDKNAEVVVHCANYQCAASASVAKQLKELGFEKVSSYEAGIAAWYQEGNPVEGAVAQGAPVSDYLTKVVDQPTQLATDVAVISTQALKDRLTEEGLLKVESAPAAVPLA